MSLRGTATSRTWWFLEEAALIFPVILLLSSGCTTASAPGPESPAQVFRYNHRLFSMELTNVEVFDDEVKLTFLYTNRADRPRDAGVGIPTDRRRTSSITWEDGIPLEPAGREGPFPLRSLRRFR